jgi:hypothetical protein
MIAISSETNKSHVYPIVSCGKAVREPPKKRHLRTSRTAVKYDFPSNTNLLDAYDFEEWSRIPRLENVTQVFSFESVCRWSEHCQPPPHR